MILLDLFLYSFLIFSDQEKQYFEADRYEVKKPTIATKKDEKYENAKEKLKKLWKEKEKKEEKRKVASEEKKEDSSKIEEYVLGVKSEDIKSIKKKIPPNDIRHNIMEVYVAPGLLYFDADSEFFYRKNRTYSPSLNLGTKIWFSPFTGFKADYLTSLGASAEDGLSGADTNIVSHEWFKFSLLKRIFLENVDSYLQFSLNYRSYRFKAPVDSTSLGNIENSFWGFGMSYHSHKAEGLSKEMGIKLFMIGEESERGASVDFSSGSLDKSYSLSIYRGWKYRLSRKHAFFTNLIYQYDKQIYEGQVTPTDPISGLDLEGIEVESSYLLLQLGYEWGS